MILYSGLFISGKEAKILEKLEQTPLEITPNNFHVTFKYKPNDEEINNFYEVIGREIEVKVIGYACNGKNSGFRLFLPSDIMPYYLNIVNGKMTIPHITTSFSKNSAPKFTKNLHFKKLDNPVIIKGRLGLFVTRNEKSYITFDKEKNDL